MLSYLLILQVLVQNRADPNIADNKDQTPLSLAKDEKIKSALQTQATPAPTPGLHIYIVGANFPSEASSKRASKANSCYS